MTDTPTDDRSQLERYEADIRAGVSITWGSAGAASILSGYRAAIVAATREAVAQEIDGLMIPGESAGSAWNVAVETAAELVRGVLDQDDPPGCNLLPEEH